MDLVVTAKDNIQVIHKMLLDNKTPLCIKELVCYTLIGQPKDYHDKVDHDLLYFLEEKPYDKIYQRAAGMYL